MILGMARAPTNEQFSDQEIARRTEAALRAAFNTPHKTYEESKIGKRRAKPIESPDHRKPVKK